jgi:hypothetical protein
MDSSPGNLLSTRLELAPGQFVLSRVDDFVFASERVQDGDEYDGSHVRCRLLHERLGHQSAQLSLVAGILGQPAVAREDAEDPALLSTENPAPGQPRVQRLT